MKWHGILQQDSGKIVGLSAMLGWAPRMGSEIKTVRQLQAMVLAELEDSSVNILVYVDPVSGAWGAMSVGDVTLEIVVHVQQIVERLRAKCECIGESII